MLQLKSKKEFLQQSMPEMQKILINEKQLGLEQEKLELRRNVLKMVQSQELDILNIIENTEDIIPDELFALSLSVSKDSINISGVAKSDVAVADFIRSMRQTGLFEKVFVSSVQNDGSYNQNTNDMENDKNYKFNMNCTLKTVKGN
jgi:Tfp pilus assembly protein PilN